LGHSDQEIKDTFSRFDSDDNKILDEEEQMKMRNELEEKKLAVLAENSDDLCAGFTKVNQKFCNNLLGHRVVQLECSISKIASKIDGITVRLEIMEKNKEALEKLLNIFQKGERRDLTEHL
ncbi:hypothetical protein scyTo_0015209, partial [Scyliorhinus torazame]|nr:hypothetical protein [Scyliorhinus torazame]